jgi:hypothetical protein
LAETTKTNVEFRKANAHVITALAPEKRKCFISCIVGQSIVEAPSPPPDNSKIIWNSCKQKLETLKQCTASFPSLTLSVNN